MEINYWIYGDDLKQCGSVFDSEVPIELSIMNQKDKLWVEARVMLFKKPADGAEPVGLLGSFGQPYDEGKYYIRIIDILPEKEIE